MDTKKCAHSRAYKKAEAEGKRQGLDKDAIKKRAQEALSFFLYLSLIFFVFSYFILKSLIFLCL